jgi:excisionase family DNA binding protein
MTAYLRPRDAAKLAGVARGTVNRWAREGVIPSVRLSPKAVRIPRDEFLAFLTKWRAECN